MPLSADEQKLLDELTAKASEPDSVDVWVRDDKSGRSIQVGGDYARKLLKEFGLLDELDAGDGDGDPGDGDGDPKGKSGKEPKPPSGHRFFQ